MGGKRKFINPDFQKDWDESGEKLTEIVKQNPHEAWEKFGMFLK